MYWRSKLLYSSLSTTTTGENDPSSVGQLLQPLLREPGHPGAVPLSCSFMVEA
jgi:hypothetical protein